MLQGYLHACGPDTNTKYTNKTKYTRTDCLKSVSQLANYLCVTAKPLYIGPSIVNISAFLIEPDLVDVVVVAAAVVVIVVAVL